MSGKQEEPAVIRTQWQETVCALDIFFEHLKFDGALEYYQQALELDPQNEMLRQKAPMTKQIMEGTLIPEAQAYLQ